MYLYFKNTRLYAYYQLLALPQVYFYTFITTLNLKACKINNATGASAKSENVLDVSNGGGGGGGGGGLQKNVHMTFLVDKINI